MREAASFIASQSGSVEAGILQTVLQKAHETIEAWRQRKQIRALAEFDDHMLADIGLSRRDVREALELPFSHDPSRELQLRASHSRSRGWNI